jgi:hypothetical protein
MKPVRILAVICAVLLLTVTGQSPEPVDTKVYRSNHRCEKTYAGDGDRHSSQPTRTVLASRTPLT